MCLPMMPILSWINHSGKPLAMRVLLCTADCSYWPTCAWATKPSPYVERQREELDVPVAATIALAEQVRAAS